MIVELQDRLVRNAGLTAYPLPKISIIIPSYNQAKFLERTILSVLNQEYPNIELIIIDGGSSDGSVDIIKKYDNHIHFWVSEKDRGQADALNKGFRKASGEIMGWLNSDDYYEKGAFFGVSKILSKPEYQFFCGACTMVDETGNFIQRLFTQEITRDSLIRYWRPHFCPPQPSIFFKSECLRDLGYLNVSLNYAMDYDLWLKAAHKYKFYITPENVSYYTIHSASKSGSEGGLSKFIPEWKAVIGTHIKKESRWFRWKFRMEEAIQMFSSANKKRMLKVKKLFSGN